MLLHFTAKEHVYMNISMYMGSDKSVAKINWAEPYLKAHLETYNLTTDFLGTDVFPLGETQINRTGTGPCKQVIFEYKITVDGKYEMGI